MKLPLAQKNKKQNIDIDEVARDGYDWPNRLVIETSKDSLVNLPSYDNTEHCMKTRSDQDGDPQQQRQLSDRHWK